MRLHARISSLLDHIRYWVVLLTVAMQLPAHAAEVAVRSDDTGVPAPAAGNAGAKPAGHTHPQSALGLGPLRLSSQSPGQSLRLGLVPHTPADLATGEWKFYAGSSWVNVWAQEMTHELDFEMLTTEALVAYGMTNEWAIEVGATSRVTFGGHMDGFIEGFHDAFGLDQQGRDGTARNRTHVRIDPNSEQPGLVLDDTELQGNRLFNLRGALLYTLSHGHDVWPAAAITCTLQVPVGERRGYGGNLVDVSLDLSLAKTYADLVIYGSVAWTRFGADRLYDLDLHRSNWAGFGALEWRVTSDWSLLLQYLVSQGIAPDLYSLSKPSHELTLGTQLRVGRHTIMQLGLIENVFIFDNSPDFGVHLALEMRL
jgi:hypothetical protein